MVSHTHTASASVHQGPAVGMEGGAVCLLRARLTSGELAHNSHGDVGTSTGAPQPAAALDPIAAVVAQHARAQARWSPVRIVHSCVVLPDKHASCGRKVLRRCEEGNRRSFYRWEGANTLSLTFPTALPFQA